MDINKVIEILEALASGCSPTTGEVMESDSVLNERNTIRALQIAIDLLKKNETVEYNTTEIDKDDIRSVVQLFKEENQNLTPNIITNFFLGDSKIKNEKIINDKLFGKYKKVYQKGQLLDMLTQYLSEHKSLVKKERKNEPWEGVDFFKKETFNRLSEEAIGRLKEKVNELGILKTEKLPEYVVVARAKYPRVYESWVTVEDELLKNAMQHTNDLTLLSECFQRGEGSIEIRGKKLLYEEQNPGN